MTDKQSTTQLEAMRIAGIKVPDGIKSDEKDKYYTDLIYLQEKQIKLEDEFNNHIHHVSKEDDIISRIDSLESITHTLADSPVENKNEYYEKEIGSIYKELREVKEELCLYKKLFKVFWLLSLGYLVGSFIDKIFGDE